MRLFVAVDSVFVLSSDILDAMGDEGVEVLEEGDVLRYHVRQRVVRCRLRPIECLRDEATDSGLLIYYNIVDRKTLNGQLHSRIPNQRSRTGHSCVGSRTDTE